eukprot:COSAG05_NODE_11_length_38500_cov_831.349861_21_plen_162_part_00
MWFLSIHVWFAGGGGGGFGLGGVGGPGGGGGFGVGHTPDLGQGVAPGHCSGGFAFGSHGVCAAGMGAGGRDAVAAPRRARNVSIVARGALTGLLLALAAPCAADLHLRPCTVLLPYTTYSNTCMANNTAVDLQYSASIMITGTIDSRSLCNRYFVSQQQKP